MPAPSMIDYGMMSRMSSEAIVQIREISAKLDSFDEPGTIRRADELEGVADQIASCAADLLDVEEPARVQYRLTVASRSVRTAQKLGRAYKRNPLTRPLSHARFALNLGKARGGLQGVLEILGPDEGADTSTEPRASS